MAFYSDDAIGAIGFKSVGHNARISDKASIYNPANIDIGRDTRIDDFCVLSAGDGGISIGSHVHLAVYTSLIGAGPIRLDDFCNLSSRVSVYSSNDDYSGEFMTSPVVPNVYTNVHSAPVRLGRHVIVGSGTVILPGVTLHDGVAVGALSLVNRDCAAFGVYAGVPVRPVGTRSRRLLELERQFRESTAEHG
jgi:galactoside O-acetyltransferase